MDKLKFLATDNAVADVYSNVGVFIPVGAAVGGSSAKPSITPLASTSTTTTITANFNVSTFEDITAMSYTLNSGSPVSVGSPVKGVNTIELTGLTENSGPHVITLSVTNENGTTTASQTIALQPYTNWASADEILAGNKAISNGTEVVGTIPARTDASITTSGMTVSIPNGYYPNSMTVTPTAPTETTTLIENGTYTPSSGKVGFSEVTVAVPNGTEITTITENGTYTPSDDKVGFSEVIVNVPNSYPTGGGEITSITYVEHIVQSDPDSPTGMNATGVTMPTLDTTNHYYFLQIFINRWDYGSEAYKYMPSNAFPDNSYDSFLNNEIEFSPMGDEYSITDENGNQLATADALVCIYEDQPYNLKYVIPTTYNNPTIQ